MTTAQLLQVTVFLAAAAIAAPLGRYFGLGAVLGYLAAGVVIGPYVLGPLYDLHDVESVLDLGEFGVVLLLFVIGLELRPVRLWSMRSSIFGLGAAQLVLTGFVLAGMALALGLATAQALFVGLALSLSSTAFALQVLEEKGELTTRHGRLAFSVLLFQDLAAIPLIALVPLFALGGEEPSMDLTSAGLALLTIAGVIIGGRFLLSRLYRLVAAMGVHEAMTASALVTVVGVALLMEQVGLSAALGSFIAGALLADSEYRHQIEADIAPFEGLLLAVFFMAVGMSIDLSVLVSQPGALITIAAGLIAVKFAVLYGLGRWWGLRASPSRRLGIVLSQGGEFAFVLFAAGLAEGVIGRDLSRAVDARGDAVHGGDAAASARGRWTDAGEASRGARLRDAAGGRTARDRRRLRPLRADRRPCFAGKAHSVHRARRLDRASGFRQALRCQDLLRRCGADRHLARGGRRQSQRLRACHRRCGRLAACGGGGAQEFSRSARLCARATAFTCTSSWISV